MHAPCKRSKHACVTVCGGKGSRRATNLRLPRYTPDRAGGRSRTRCTPVGAVSGWVEPATCFNSKHKPECMRAQTHARTHAVAPAGTPLNCCRGVTRWLMQTALWSLTRRQGACVCATQLATQGKASIWFNRVNDVCHQSCFDRPLGQRRQNHHAPKRVRARIFL